MECDDEHHDDSSGIKNEIEQQIRADIPGSGTVLQTIIRVEVSTQRSTGCLLGWRGNGAPGVRGCKMRY